MGHKWRQVGQSDCFCVATAWNFVENVQTVSFGGFIYIVLDFDYLGRSDVISHQTRLYVDFESIAHRVICERKLRVVVRNTDRSLNCHVVFSD